MSSNSVMEAKDALLRTLEELDNAEEELGGPPDRVDLVVVYSIGRKHESEGSWHEIGGWSSTSGPKWLHAALLRRAADANDEAARALDDGEEE